jgi:trehalose 2-sulfotransferase
VQPRGSYIIYATPRSGSTLLCEALINTGLAGRPEEPFEFLKATGRPRRPLEYFTGVEDAELIKLLSGREGPPWSQPTNGDYAEYLATVIEQATTPNGIFGTKLMWGYLDDFVNNLRTLPAYSTQPVPELFTTIFPNLHHITVIRRDKVRQAVSLWKAIQTQSWAHEDDELAGGKAHQHTPIFYFGAIDHLKRQLEEHDAAWQQYFTQNNIEPYRVVYEDFVPTYEETTLEILRYLDVSIPEKLTFSTRRMKRQADALSDQWIQLYHEQRRAREEQQQEHSH